MSLNARTSLLLALLPGLIVPFIQGCGQKDTPLADDENVVVLPGKKDDFFAPRAREYRIEGDTTVTLEASYAGKPEAERLARARELVSLRQVVVNWFLNAYLVDKSEHDSNKDYGGFEALTKNGSYEDLGLAPVSGETYSFHFVQEAGGQNDMISKLPTTTGADGLTHFELIVGKVSNSEMAQLETNHAWYRNTPWSGFDPATVDPSKVESLDLTITPEPRSVDAWIDTPRLFADGELTISAHFGWDYHSNYHLKHSREVYDWLVNRQGFKSPVESYDAYTRSSGPFTKTLKAGGKNVAVKVSLFWGKPGTETDPDTDAGGIILENDLRDALAKNDVIIYSGHSGSFYGFAMGNWRKTAEGDLDDSELPGLNMPAKYQLVMAEGCDTYALGQAFFENPAKAERDNLDIITTTSFSNASTAGTVQDFMTALFGADNAGNHKAKRFGELLADLDNNSSWFNTMYGVHGIDDNPHRHPYANEASSCESCRSDADCGGAGNVCAKLGTNGRACTMECTADDGCPGGFKCLDIASGSWLTKMACVPDGLSCDHPTVQPDTKGTVILNELGADPAPGSAGDWNGDGTRSATQDEFVELVNTTTKPLKIGDWTLADGYTGRFVFPTDAVIPAGGAVLIFGGGQPANFRGVQTFVAERGLGLNNGGDTLTLADARGSIVNQLSYGREASHDVSLTRAVDGDGSSAMVPHDGAGASPGTRQDGTDF